MTAAAPPSTGREMSSPPTDGISNLRFSNHSDHLLVSSWDKSADFIQLRDDYKSAKLAAKLSSL